MMDMCVAYGGKEWNELLRSSFGSFAIYIDPCELIVPVGHVNINAEKPASLLDTLWF